MINVDESNFEDEVLKNDKLVVVDFWAPWCQPCLRFSPVFEELSGEYEGKLKFAKLNTDEEQGLASQYSIQGIPCLIVTKEGNEVDRITGFAPKEVLKQKIDTILDKI